MIHQFILLAFACYSGLALGLDIRGKVQWNELCPDIGDLGYARAILNDGAYSGSIIKSGDFIIPNVAPGTYLLSVRAHDHVFDQVRVDVPADSDSAALPEMRPYVPGTPLSPPSTVLLPYPITLTARRKNDYFLPPPSFNALALLQSPMVLMMVFGGVMMFAMPMLMKNMDPESLKEFEGRHAKMTGIQQSLASGDFKSGLSQLMDASEDAPAAASSAVTPSKGKNGKVKRR